MSVIASQAPSHSFRASVISSVEKLHLFQDGAFFTSHALQRRIKRPLTVAILMALGGAPFELRVDDCVRSYEAVCIKPLVEYEVRASSTPLVSVLVGPDHPNFSAFRSISRNGVMALWRRSFAQFDDAMDALYRGLLDVEKKRGLFHGVINKAVQNLPAVDPVDPRIQKIMQVSRSGLDIPFEQLARSAHISYHRLSHLFSQEMGIPWRSYRIWRRMHTALELMADGCPQTEVVSVSGFADASHLWRTCRSAYGVSPAMFSAGHIDITRAEVVETA